MIITKDNEKVNEDMYFNLNIMQNLYSKKKYIYDKLNLKSFMDVSSTDIKYFDVKNNGQLLLLIDYIGDEGFFDNEEKDKILNKINRIFRYMTYDIFWTEGLGDVIFEHYFFKQDKIFDKFNKLHSFDIDEIIHIIKEVGECNE